MIDNTSLTGKFDLDLDNNKIMSEAGADFGNPSSDRVFQATTDALESIGLHVARTKASIDVLVVDRAQRPSTN